VHLLSLWHVPAEHYSMYEVRQTLDAHLVHSAGAERQSQVQFLVPRMSIIESLPETG
jgi:hypothetical protein